MKKTTLFLALALSSTPALAGGGSPGGVATEFTQMLNNVELVSSVAQQAQVVSNGIQQYLTQFQQLKTMQQNLLQLDPAAIQQALGPLGGNIVNLVQPYAKLYQATTGLQSTATGAAQLIARDTNAMKMAGMSPGQYYSNLAKYSAQKASWAQQDMQQRQQAAQDMQKRVAALNAAAAQIPNVDGNIKGFQTLSTISAQAAQEAQVTNSILTHFATVEDAKMQESASHDQSAAQLNQQLLNNAQMSKIGDALNAQPYFKGRGIFTPAAPIFQQH